MIIRNKFQFRGAIRIFLGVCGLVITSLALWKGFDDGLEAYVFGLPLAIGVLSFCLLMSGIRARCKPPVYRIDESGFQYDIGAHLSKEIRWEDATAVRRSGDRLILVSNDGEAHFFDLSGLNHGIEKIVSECLARFRQSAGLVPVRDTILAAPPVLCCQDCGESTENLKTRVSFVIVFAYMFGYVWKKQSMACPRCTRRSAYKFALINLLPANLIWPIVVVPICLFQWASSFRSGHSRSVIDAL